MASDSSAAAEFETRLGLIIGDEFERIVCRVLADHHLDFQPVPRQGGDGGVDGLSHGLTHAYCCYGPEAVGKKALDKALRDNIVDKFRSDIRRIFEVKPQGKTKLVHAENNVLAAVLDGQKLVAIRLVCNTFRDNRVIGRLNTAFRKAREASKLNHVADDCGLTIWGPRELGDAVAVTEQVLFRVRNRALCELIESRDHATERPADDKEEVFDAKFDDLSRRVSCGKVAAVKGLRERYRAAWLRAMGLEQTLSVSAPALHARFERLRESARRAAVETSLTVDAPMGQLQAAFNDLHSRVEKLFREIGVADVDDIAVGEVSRLIGHCDLDWRAHPATDEEADDE